MKHIVNYPRFPENKVEMGKRAEEIMHGLACGLYQKSATIEYPDRTVYFAFETGGRS